MKFTRRNILHASTVLPWISSRCLPIPTKDPFDFADDEDESEPMNFDDSRPVTLRSSAVITGNSDEEVNAAPLTNATGQPMEIHEFIFSVRPTDATIAKYGSFGAFPSGGQFAIKMAIKDAAEFGYALTNGAIPLWSFGQARQLGEEETLQEMEPLTATVGAGTLLPSTSLIGTYAWKLDHPLFVPPGARIVPVTRSLGSFTGDAVIGVTAIGRVWPNTPLSRPSYKMPWVCSYLTKSFGFTESAEDSSNDDALYNPFPDRDVIIERFVGRLHMLTNIITEDGLSVDAEQVAVQDTSQLDAGASNQFDYIPNSFYSRLLAIRMRDSVGNPIVREKTLFRSVFESATRTWECRHVLPPRQFHKIDFYKAAALGATTERPSRLQASVSSIGWREVSWKRA